MRKPSSAPPSIVCRIPPMILLAKHVFSLFHPGILPSTLSSVYQRPLVLVPWKALRSPLVPLMPYSGKRNPSAIDSHLKQLKCHFPSIFTCNPHFSFIRHTSTRHNTGDTTMTKSAHRNRSSKTQKQTDAKVAAFLIPASYWESFSFVNFVNLSSVPLNLRVEERTALLAFYNPSFFRSNYYSLYCTKSNADRCQ